MFNDYKGAMKNIKIYDKININQYHFIDSHTLDTNKCMGNISLKISHLFLIEA